MFQFAEKCQFHMMALKLNGHSHLPARIATYYVRSTTAHQPEWT
jgi:hypothetical protein